MIKFTLNSDAYILQMIGGGLDRAGQCFYCALPFRPATAWRLWCRRFLDLHEASPDQAGWPSGWNRSVLPAPQVSSECTLAENQEVRSYRVEAEGLIWRRPHPMWSWEWVEGPRGWSLRPVRGKWVQSVADWKRVWRKERRSFVWSSFWI